MRKPCPTCHGEGAVRNCRCKPDGKPECRCGWEVCGECFGLGTVTVPDRELEAAGQLRLEVAA